MTAITDTTVDVADLYGQPGASRRIRRTLDATLMPEVPLVVLVEPVSVTLLLESLVDEILARGTVSAAATLSCGRCLADIPTKLSSDVLELFADPRRSDDADDVEEGYEITDVTSHPVIHLETLVRDALTEDMPLRPLCRADCAGLCATCGADLNSTTCDCHDDVGDDRWAVLRTLDLPEAPTN